MIDNLAKQAYNLGVAPRIQSFIGRNLVRMRNSLIRFMALLCALTFFSLPAQAASSHSELQRQINEICEECNPVGVSVAYVSGGAVRDTFAWGWATYPHDPMTADTNVRIASISKVLVGIAAHYSAQAGTLELDGPIDNALGYRLARRSSADVVSPRSILTHTSSIVPNEYATGVFDGVIELLSDPDNFYSAVSGSLKDWDYNNFAFYVLGLAIEKANGKTMDEILNPALCDPLGIDASFWAGDLKDQSHIATQYDKDHRPFLTVPMQTEIHNSGVAANGSVFAGNYHISARDLGKIVATLAADGCYEGAQILDPAIVEALEAHENRLVPEQNFYQCQPLRCREGLFGRELMYYHTGSAYGAQCLICYDPELGDGVVVLSSGGAGVDRYGLYRVCGKIAALLLSDAL